MLTPWDDYRRHDLRPQQGGQSCASIPAGYRNTLGPAVPIAPQGRCRGASVVIAFLVANPKPTPALHPPADRTVHLLLTSAPHARASRLLSKVADRLAPAIRTCTRQLPRPAGRMWACVQSVCGRRCTRRAQLENRVCTFLSKQGFLAAVQISKIRVESTT